MKEKLRELLIRWRETIAYLFFGVLTVVVNTMLFLLLDLFLDEMVANTLAFLLSVLFAYWTNTLFVFQQRLNWKTFSAFFGMRIGTIFIDNGGMYLLLRADFGKLFSKCAVNAVIIVLNYLFSKFIIYKKKEA